MHYLLDYVAALALLLSHEILGLNIKRLLTLEVVIMLYARKYAEGFLTISSHLNGMHEMVNVIAHYN